MAVSDTATNIVRLPTAPRLFLRDFAERHPAIRPLAELVARYEGDLKMKLEMLLSEALKWLPCTPLLDEEEASRAVASAENDDGLVDRELGWLRHDMPRLRFRWDDCLFGAFSPEESHDIALRVLAILARILRLDRIAWERPQAGLVPVRVAAPAAFST